MTIPEFRFTALVKEKETFSSFDIVDFRTGHIKSCTALELLITTPIPTLSVYRKDKGDQTKDIYRTKVVQLGHTGELPKSIAKGIAILRKLQPKIDSGAELTALQAVDIVKANSALGKLIELHTLLDKKELARWQKSKHRHDGESELCVATVQRICLEPSQVISGQAREELSSALRLLNESNLGKNERNAAAATLCLRNRTCYTKAAMEVSQFLSATLSQLRAR